MKKKSCGNEMQRRNVERSKGNLPMVIGKIKKGTEKYELWKINENIIKKALTYSKHID